MSNPPPEPAARQEPRLREYWDAFRIYVDGISQEARRLNLLSERRGLERLPYWIYFFIVAVAVLIIPTWEGESTVFFAAVLALAAGWLVAVAQATPSLSTEDVKLLERGIAKFGPQIRAAAERRGKKLLVLNLPAGQQSWLGRIMPKLLAGGVEAIVVQIMFGRAVRAIELAGLSILGLLSGPWLSHFHLGYWSPVSILFALAVPDSLLLLGSLLVPVLLKLFMASIRFDEMDLGKPPPEASPPANR